MRPVFVYILARAGVGGVDRWWWRPRGEGPCSCRHHHTFIADIRPRVEYAAPVGSTYLRWHIDLQEKVQRRAVKIVLEILELSYNTHGSL